ncbi:hypothetical protein FDP08_20210 [Marinobacter panjinensis]|uniref:Uncharacterized protein n=1 Tax=Marinobacter panjinensis TaxID=2576384 RepID=A0A4U6QTI1_9GAMM|nr:hypothetical protein [Marinobacter panjinensis]MCR8916359.1 hypothetical protein [Marinobacter panjinensis]TKV63416.1 hypothetical protein FDP08_20210 [Marinobacter panjinensis]
MNKQYCQAAFVVIAIFGAKQAAAELDRLDDQDLAEVSGQGGIYLSGDISINEMGGPIENSYFGRCDNPDKKCGARLAYRLKADGGWMVLDEIRGNFAFEGLTLRVRSIDSGFGGDGELFNRDVMEIGLPDIVRYNDVRFKIAGSNMPRPTDPGFRQTDILAVEMQGEVIMEGNLLVFPTGNP